MPERMSPDKVREVLTKALHAQEGGQDELTLTTASLIRLLRHIQGLHSTLREIQLDLLPASVTSDPAKLHQAVVSSLGRIDEMFGPLGSLFDEASETSETKA